MEEKTQSQAARVPVYVWAVVLVALIASLIFLTSAVYLSFYQQNLEWAGYLLLAGTLLLVMSTYVVVQVRNRAMHRRIEAPPITITMECKACGEKNVREFQRGDYIFKEGDACQKCKGGTLITSIYREVKEKDKERFPF